MPQSSSVIIHGGIASHCCNYADWSRPVILGSERRLLAQLELQPSTVDRTSRPAIIGVANVVTSRMAVGREQLRRAGRVATGLGNPSRTVEAEELLQAAGAAQIAYTEADAPPPDLDSAVALMELAACGYPGARGDRRPDGRGLRQSRRRRRRNAAGQRAK